METKKDILEYISRYCSEYYTELERKADDHHLAQTKLLRYKDRDGHLGEKYNQMTSTDPQVLELLKDGYSEFRKRVIERIYNEQLSKLNRCPKCNGLARTPRARQCRYCWHDWH